MTILVRPATVADAAAAAVIGAHAFKHIPLMVERYSFLPHDVERWHPIRTAWMAKCVITLRQRLMIAYDSKTSAVVGYALYERFGSSQVARRVEAEKFSLLMSIERALTAAAETLWRWATETAAECELENKVKRVYETMDERSWGKHSERWFLESLAVDEKWRGCGVGRKLVEKGIEWAKAEGVPLVLEATDQGKFLYEKLGFEMVREPEEIEGVQMGCTMRWMEP